MGYNHIIIHGRVCNDIEVKTTQSGIAVATFSVAVDRQYKSGEDKITDFFSVTAWRGLAEMIGRNFHKGKEIIIGGKMQSRKYVDKSGNNRIAWEILADEVDFCGSKGDTDGAKKSEPKWEEVADDASLPF